MIDLRITGDTPDQFLANLGIFLQSLGARAVPLEQTAAPGGEVSDETQGIDGTEKDVVIAEPNPPVVEPVKKRGRPKKDAEPVTIEATPEPEEIVEKKPEATPITIDAIRARIMAVIDAHKTRGNDMPAVTAYVMQLFKPFGIKKAAECPPERFEEFMVASQAYLDGTATVD